MQRLLIIDPNPGALIVARNILARGGYTVITAASISEGIRRIEGSQPDLYLLDATAVTTGIQSLVAWHREGHRMRALLLVPRGRGVSTIRGASEWMEVVGCVAKPFDADELTGAVRDCFAPQTELLAPQLLAPQLFDPVQVPAPSSSTTEAITVDADRDDPVLSVEEVASLDGLEDFREAFLELNDPEPAVPLPPATDFGPEPIASGRLGLITVAQLLQFAEGLEVPVACHVHQADRSVEIHVAGRQVVFAQSSDRPEPEPDEGRIAELVYLAVGWTEGTFSMRPTRALASDPGRVELPLAFLLLEGLRRLDESRANSAAA